jgi:ankyrin repeat protein
MEQDQLYMDPELYEAVIKGDIKLFEELLRAGQAPNDGHECQIPINVVAEELSVDSNETSPLLRVTHWGDTVLHIAVRSSQIELACRICKESISLLTKGNTKMETPLHYAAQDTNLEMVTTLIRLAREARVRDDSALLYELLRKTNTDGETALHYAVRHKRREVIKTLMREDPHLACIPDNRNISPLYSAVTLGSLDTVACLVDQFSLGVPQEAYAGPDGQNALHAAAIRAPGIRLTVYQFELLPTNFIIIVYQTPLIYNHSKLYKILLVFNGLSNDNEIT